MKKRKVIIDCDPGIDDSLAIMLALQSEELEIVGITIVCGNCPVEMGFGNAKKVLKHMGRLDVPVYIGVEKPLRREYVNALDTHGEDGLGPMTNFATLLEQDRVAFDQIEEFVSMGGTFKSHGNCSPVAEYNYWCDPDAAAKVYDAMYQNGRKIHMIGLDVTREIVLTPTILEYMCRINAKRGAFIKKITKFYFDFHWQWEHIVGCVINDPLAVAYFIDPSICEGFESFVQIETEGISLGQSVVDSMNFYRKEPNAKVLTQVDTYRFFEMMLSRVLEVEPESLDILENVL